MMRSSTDPGTCANANICVTPNQAAAAYTLQL